MTLYNMNQLATDSTPREAAVGTLAADSSIDDVVRILTDAAIAADRIYFLQGDEGAALIEQSGNFVSRLLESELRAAPIAALRSGLTLIVVYGVERDDADAVRTALSAAGVTDQRYFGRWTYT